MRDLTRDQMTEYLRDRAESVVSEAALAAFEAKWGPHANGNGAASSGEPRPDKAPVRPTLPDAPMVRVERKGPSYFTRIDPPGLAIDFRDVRTDGELSAEVTVAFRGRRLFTTTTTLSLTARRTLAKTAAERVGMGEPPADWRDAIFEAVEAVLAQEESLRGEVDLRTATADAAGSLFVARPVWETGPTLLVGPGNSGKSTFGRALAVSVAGDLAVVPGVTPTICGPVLYVAGEDAGAIWHVRSIEAICRGLGTDRSSLPHPIVLFDAAGRPIHRIARAIAERAADFAGVILDPLSALLAAGDQVRDRDNLFWRGVDTLERPTFIIAHPNLVQARRWAEADGRVAGSEVNRDRVRLSWAARWQDEPALVGTSFRRYTLENTKTNHGPPPPPLSFAMSWEFGRGDSDSGVVRFMESEPVRTRDAASSRPLTKQQEETLAAVRAGATTPVALAKELNIEPAAAKTRLRRVKEQGLFPGFEESGGSGS